jgi:hypothetical protein
MSPKNASDRFVVRRKESGASSGDQPGFSIARTVSRPERAGSDVGSVEVSSGPGARTGSGGKLADSFSTASAL